MPVTIEQGKTDNIRIHDERENVIGRTHNVGLDAPEWWFKADNHTWFGATRLREIADALDRLKEEQDD